MEKNEKSTEQFGGSAHLISGCDSTDSLVTRLRLGERVAAETVVDIYYQQVYLYLRRLGHSRQISEDLTQETFLSAWQHVGQLRGGKGLNGWLYRIAGNISRQYWRRHHDTADIDSIAEPEKAESAYGGVHGDQLIQLKKAVEHLPLKLRQAVVLHYMQCLTISEAAEALGVREGTLKSRINRALGILRKQTVSENE